jgi:hypothetical protein
MNYKQLIKNWHIRANENDYFSKFVFEYLAFIAFLKTQKYLNENNDRSAIQKLKRDTQIKDKYLSKINSNHRLKSNWGKVKQELESRRLGNTSRDLNNVEEIKWWNFSYDKPEQMTEDEKNKLKGDIHSLNDWENMVEFWHSIRNNLFHGSKNPEDERDQFLAEYGFKTLKELMEIFLNEQDEIQTN